MNWKDEAIAAVEDAMRKHAAAREIDAKFDAGEFSYGASARAEDAEVDVIAARYGFTREALDSLMQEFWNRIDANGETY